MYMIYKFFVVPETNYYCSNNNHMDLFEQKLANLYVLMVSGQNPQC